MSTVAKRSTGTRRNPCRATTRKSIRRTTNYDCRIDEKGATVAITLDGKYHNGRITLPLLENNGSETFDAVIDRNRLAIANVEIENLSGNDFKSGDLRLANRSGIYRIFTVPLKDGKAVLRFSVKP